MNTIAWSVSYFLLLLVHLSSISEKLPWLGYASKPLLLLVLVGWFIQATYRNASQLRLFFLTALLFSWAGDVLLMFESLGADFFIAGVAAFMLAQLMFTFSLRNFLVLQRQSVNYLLLIPVLGFYSILMYYLYPRLGTFKIPVIIYAGVISTMLFFALQFVSLRHPARQMILAGAVMFVLSDSLLAMNKFYARFNFAEIYVMLTYGLAQWALTAGFIRILSNEPSTNKQAAY